MTLSSFKTRFCRKSYTKFGHCFHENDKKCENLMKNKCFRPENEFSSVYFAENFLGDGEKYAGSYGSALVLNKIRFCEF